MLILQVVDWDTCVRVSSRNFILGGKITNHVAVRSRQREGRLHNYNILGGSWVSLGEKLSCLGGKLPLRPPP